MNEDVFPVEDGDFPYVMLVFGGVPSCPAGSSHLDTRITGGTTSKANRGALGKPEENGGRWGPIGMVYP